MIDSTDNIVLEHLKRFQAGQDRIERKLEEVVTRIGHFELGLAGLRRDSAYTDEAAAGMSVRMDRMNDRIERVERRLELA